ncbi:hypothetical protein ACRQ5Q_33120 [Bradyrhizobium sp. PMVTL-01]|uniref:hypothetical protein n=1 Tax=Bradyrhizobium sp. PMVTL-01 TaxID=3434999 RepID=UPI003F7104E8
MKQSALATIATALVEVLFTFDRAGIRRSRFLLSLDDYGRLGRDWAETDEEHTD